MEENKSEWHQGIFNSEKSSLTIALNSTIKLIEEAVKIKQEDLIKSIKTMAEMEQKFKDK